MSAKTSFLAAPSSAELAELVENLISAVKTSNSDRVGVLIAEHPEHADALMRLLPAVQLMADLSRSSADGLATNEEIPLGELGDFRIMREVGRGGMGIVYEAEQISLGRRVALKVLPLAATMDSRHLQRFKNEAKAAANLKDEHIVSVYAVGCERGVHFYAMEFIDGLTLSEMIGQASRDLERSVASIGESPVADAADATKTVAFLSTKRDRSHFRTIASLIADAADALEHAHAMGIVHRDIKPGNLLLDNDGKIYVSDFGLARFGPEPGVTMTGDMIGTLRYMSPEAALAKHGLVDHRTDIYSLGATLYELLTLKPAVEGADKGEILKSIAWDEPTPLRKQDKSIPTELETITLKCLAKEPAERYATAGELAEDLRRWLGNQTIKAKPPSLRQRAAKWGRRHRGVVATAGVCSIIIMLLSVAGLVINNRLVTQEKEQTAVALDRAVREKERADQNLARAREAVKQYLLKTSSSVELRVADFHDLRKKLLETAIPFYEQFALESRDDPKLELEHAQTHFDLSKVRHEIGDLKGALNDLEEAENIYDRLVSTAPQEFALRKRLVATCSARATVLHELGRSDQADRAFQHAFDTMQAAAAAQESTSEYRDLLAETCFHRGQFLAAMGRPKDAEVLLRRSATLREELLNERPNDPEPRLQLAESWIILGSTLRVMHRGVDAEKAFQSAADLLDPQLLDKVGSARDLMAKWQKARGFAFNNLGVVRREADRLVDAADAIRISLKIKEQLADQFPSVPQYRYELAGGYTNLGTILSETGQPREARTAYERAVQIDERLVAASPAVPLYAVALAGAYSNLGRHICDIGELEPSLAWVTKAVDLLEPQYRRDPRVAKVRESLKSAHWARAITLTSLERYEQSLPDLARAIDLDDGSSVVTLRIERASNLLKLKDHARVAADAQSVADTPKASAQDLYLAASLLARAARLADKSLIDQYSARAVATLRQSAAKGYAKPGVWKDDRSLESLRDREDFRQLLQELGAKHE